GGGARALVAPRRRRARARCGGQARLRPRSSAFRRTRRTERRGPLVQLLLLARRCARARLCAHGRDSSKTRVRPGGVVPRPEAARASAARSVEAAQEGGGNAYADGRDSA